MEWEIILKNILVAFLYKERVLKVKGALSRLKGTLLRLLLTALVVLVVLAVEAVLNVLIVLIVPNLCYQITLAARI